MAAHDAAAARAFPGPDFRQVLQWIHEIVKPAAYVEIGVHSGESLALIGPGTLAAGIDPAPKPGFACPEGARLYAMTSNEFFRRHDPARIFGGRPVDLALIDGLHLFEQALEDFCNLERHMSREGIVAVHDTVPLDRETSSRRRTTEFYTGDVWKLVPLLNRRRGELEIATVMTGPAGLTLVRGLDPACDHGRLRQQAAGFRDLDYDYFDRFVRNSQRTIPNHFAAVEAFCQKTPVQSTRSSGAATPSA